MCGRASLTDCVCKSQLRQLSLGCDNLCSVAFLLCLSVYFLFFNNVENLYVKHFFISTNLGNQQPTLFSPRPCLSHHLSRVHVYACSGRGRIRCQQRQAPQRQMFWFIAIESQVCLWCIQDHVARQWQSRAGGLPAFWRDFLSAPQHSLLSRTAVSQGRATFLSHGMALIR